MNRILINTHKQENINLLKLRDYYFDRARVMNRWATLLMSLPILLAVINLTPLLSSITWLQDGWEVAIGLLTVLLWVAVYLINQRVEDCKERSNQFREEYDCKVFSLPRNLLYAKPDLLDSRTEEDEGIVRQVADYYKYQVWYGEVFSGKDGANVICCQMDNVIYTDHVYRETRRIYGFYLLGIILAVLTLVILIGDVLKGILLVLAASNLVYDLLLKRRELTQLIGLVGDLKNRVIENKEVIEADYDLHLRSLQDIIISARANSIFVPKFIRNKYLRDDSIYYRDLNEVKTCYYKGEEVNKPSRAEEILVSDKKGGQTIPLADLQARLAVMMGHVIGVLDQEAIPYILEGGTLLGTVREKGRFIFWDDDVDLAVPYDQLERAKAVLRERLDKQYRIQDEGDPYYSPRLSSFRVREQTISLGENDSCLYRHYGCRGLFLDLYAYGPTWSPLWLDKLVRLHLLHPRNRRLAKIERRLCIEENDKCFKRFQKAKAGYLGSVSRYMKRAASSGRWSYVPTYIDNTKKPGPYFHKDDLFAPEGGPAQPTMVWEGMICKVPRNPPGVLEAVYGKEWDQSPYQSIEALQARHGEDWYRFSNSLTALKHIKYACVVEGGEMP